MDKNTFLYIGLNGYAGSGKDTVAKMLKIILNRESNQSKETLYKIWKKYNKEHKYATSEDNLYGQVYTIAFADQLKKLASDIFGIPIQRFYNNKTNGYINISGTFEYTEQKPSDIITAEDYASGPYSYQSSLNQYWMSLREALVYVGTYVCQQNINKNIFVNIIDNKISYESLLSDFKYVICTDVRFEHEAEYIRNNNGIMINIVRNDISQLNNIAEHDLDEENDYDFIIENDGSYEELWNQVWDMVISHEIFKNEIVRLSSHDSTNNYLRLIKTYSTGDRKIYKLCMEYSCARISHNEDGSIGMIDPSGGPSLYIGSEVGYRLQGWTISKIFSNSNSVGPFGFFIELENIT
ncbi:MAG: hypothetical protein J1F35_06145 [Erysipelotrichales bacterium]|nr:hypothetical protein [Erysipelotrichales bacterium]